MKKRIVSLLLVLVLCIGTLFCVSASAETEEGHIENLIIGTSSQIETLSILSQSGAFGKFNYNDIVYANLFYEDADHNIQPAFLDSYEISEDGYQLYITFPTTCVWHDGEPVTAEDLAFTFEYRRDVYGSSSLQNLIDVEITAENAITLTFSEPDAYYYVKSNTLTSAILPKHIWEDVEDPDTYAEEDAMIGCGPYRVVEVDEDAGIIVYEAVEENNYLGDQTVDKITLKTYSDQTALLMAMANGEIDLMYDYASPISYSLLDLIEDNEDIDLGASAYTGCNQVTFGMTGEANQVLEFREAAIKSLDWELICYLCNGEYGEIPGSGIIPSSNAGYDDSLWVFYQDVDEANELLDEAGFVDADGDGWRDLPDGTSFTYKVTAQYSTKRMELFTRLGEVIAASLQEVGINAYLDEESLTSEEINDQMVADNDYDMFIGYTTSGVASYRTAFWYFVPRDIAGSGAMMWGESYNDEELNAAYTKLMKAINNEEYLEAVAELQQLASEDLFAFALCWEQCFFPYRTDKYTGFENIAGVGVVHAKTFSTLTTISE